MFDEQNYDRLPQGSSLYYFTSRAEDLICKETSWLDAVYDYANGVSVCR